MLIYAEGSLLIDIALTMIHMRGAHFDSTAVHIYRYRTQRVPLFALLLYVRVPLVLSDC